MVRIKMRDGEVVFRPTPGGLTGTVRNVQVIGDGDAPCEPCDCPEKCTIVDCGGLTLPIAFDLDASRTGTGTGTVDDCCCEHILTNHVMLNVSRMAIFCVGSDACSILKGSEECSWLSTDLDDFEVDTAGCPNPDPPGPPEFINPHIDSTGAVYRTAKMWNRDVGTGSPCCGEMKVTLGNTSFAVPGDSCSFVWTWRLSVLHITEIGSGTGSEDEHFVRFTAEPGILTGGTFSGPLETYVSDDIPIGPDLNVLDIGTVQLHREGGTGTGTGDFCIWPDTINLTPISEQGVVDRNLLGGTSGCTGDRKACCERWGAQVSLQVKPLECDLDPEEFLLTEVSPAESPRRWTGSAALSCGDTYGVEFVCTDTEEECENKFQLTFTPDCGTTDPLSAVITDCTCLEEPPRFTYTAARGEGDSSTGCNCCGPDSNCPFCMAGTVSEQYAVTMSGFGGDCFTCPDDISVFNGTFVLDRMSAGACRYRYTTSDYVIEFAFRTNDDQIRVTISCASTVFIYRLSVSEASQPIDCCGGPWTLSFLESGCVFSSNVYPATISVACVE